MRFKLLKGAHGYGKGEAAVIVRWDDKHPIVESDTDLVKAFGKEKFQRLPDQPVEEETSVEETSDELASMNEKELKKLAKAHDIDITEAANKEELINLIRAAMDAA